MTGAVSMVESRSSLAALDLPRASLEPLVRLTDSLGLVEHADGARAAPRHGYATDDAGRALALCCRLNDDLLARDLAVHYLGFIERMHIRGWRYHLRLDAAGRVTSDPHSDDASARALYGLGFAAAHAPWPEVRDAARALFEDADDFCTAHPHAAAYAAIGACELLGHVDASRAGWKIVEVALECLARRSSPDAAWPWPAPRLRYDNALWPEALLALGDTVDDRQVFDEGRSLLEWLVSVELCADRASFTPVGGRGPNDPRPAFDQQPIEAASMAQACMRAYLSTGEDAWLHRTLNAAAWFAGANDSRAVMWDPNTGGSYDGLKPDGVNTNQGAESTISFVATLAATETAMASLERRDQ